GPRSMAFSNATITVMARSGIPQDRITGALAALFQFVYGFCTIDALFKERCRAAGVSEDEYLRDVMSVVNDSPEWTATYREAAEVTERWGKQGSVTEMRQRDFEYALDTVIAGIEVMRDRSHEG
ncbi:TetR/AcrR family transcriptional regulator C-terminal domain-containing protein, partial [Streptomyces sp. URMC 127]|uniref:TetR/AcrR family transcriptional regulator C-terminal domain-containing protein n=1 Tax=Streptomyces sp. URMC 127 TaxID=3423402 RepID=UPI003F1E3957